MKKFNSFIPLIILLLLIIFASLTVYKSSTKQSIIKEEIASIGDLRKLKYPIKLRDFSVADLFDDKKNLSIEDIKNNKNRYSIINFFASWCTTCLAEHDILMRLKDEKSINFYGIAWHDYSKNAVSFLTKYGNPFDKVGLDAKGLFTKIIGLESVPETIVVSPDGFILARIQGNIDEKKMFAILNFIQTKKQEN